MKGSIRSFIDQISARVYSRMANPENFFSAATEKFELCEAEFIEGRPSKMLEGQIDRVTNSPFGGSFEDQIAIVLGEPNRVKATNMYTFRDVTVAKNWVICNNRHEEFCWPKSSWALSSPDEFYQASFSDSVQGSRYFGHWLRDDCATNLLLGDKTPILRPRRESWQDEDFYIKLLDLKPFREIEHARIRELVYIDDLSNNSHKLSRFQLNRAKIREFRKFKSPNEIVYVSRGRSARGRKIENEAHLMDVLAARGVKIVVSEEMGTASFFDEIFNASLIISAEGSQCAHALYALRDGAAGLLTLQPHDRFWLPHIEWVRLLGFDFGAVVSDPHRGDFWVDPIEVLRTIDLF